MPEVLSVEAGAADLRRRLTWDPRQLEEIHGLYAKYVAAGRPFPADLEEHSLLLILKFVRPTDADAARRLVTVLESQGKPVPADVRRLAAAAGATPRSDPDSIRAAVLSSTDQEEIQTLFAALRARNREIPLDLEEHSLRLVLREQPGNEDVLDRLLHVLNMQGKDIPPELDARMPANISALHPFLSRQDVFRTLYLAVEYVFGAGVEGHIAEFGTMTGRTAEVLAKAMATFERRLGYADALHGIPERSLMLFDSFDGLPEVQTEVDRQAPHVRAGAWAPGTCRGLGPAELQRVCARHLPSDRIRIFKGWFSETLPRLKDGTTFALVHIDSDLYESARDVLTWLFERNAYADGCVLLFDDWDCNRASPAFGERKAWSEIVQRFNPSFTDCGSYGFVSHRFILHRQPDARPRR
jgi:hypothetical protein